MPVPAIPTVPNTFKVARSLGNSQRALRNQTRRDARTLAQNSVNMPHTQVNQEVGNLVGDFVKGRAMLGAEQKQLSAPKRLVSNVAQYPMRWGTGAAVTGAAAIPGARRNRGPVVKRESVPYEKTKGDPDFRPSYAIGLNPRSETYVRRNTSAGRYAATGGGAVVGNVLVPGVGGAVGATGGRNYNIQTDKVRAYRRRDKAQARGWAGLGADTGAYYYGKVEKMAQGPFGPDVAGVYYEDIEKIWGGKKLAAAGLAGAVALGGGGVGAAKAAPKIGQATQGIRNTMEYKSKASTTGGRLENEIIHRAGLNHRQGDRVADIPVARDAAGKEVTGHPGGLWRPVQTKNQWVASGKPKNWGPGNNNSRGVANMFDPGKAPKESWHKYGTTLYASGTNPKTGGMNYMRTWDPRARPKSLG